MKKIAVIGGGAAGISFAVMLGRIDSDVKITVFEALDRVGKKLATTGNGRCNITNLKLNIERFHGDKELCDRLISAYGYKEQEEFFNSIGVVLTAPEDDRVYPLSFQAASVTDALRFAAADLGVEIRVDCRVKAVKRFENAFEVVSSFGSERFDAVVVATGGQAGGKMASSDGYDILKGFGHKIESCFPSIVQIKTEPRLVRQLKGIKVNANVTISSADGVRSDFGEVLFCDYGLSGPPVLQVSRLANGKNAVITIDLLPQMSEERLKEEIEFRVKSFKNRLASELFAGFINKKLSQVIMKECGINIGGLCSEIDTKSIDKLTLMLKELRFGIIGTTGFSNAQVTAGGAQGSQFFDTLMSKKAKGLFAVGEVLNVDGDCGGFNLAFAWASAFAAANGVAEYLKEN